MRVVVILFFVFLSASRGFAQSSLPSKEEINELSAKADEKVVVFEKALQGAKPFMPEENFKKFTDAADTAHLIIRNLQKKGPSAYLLVTLVMTMDDLVIDARLTMGYILANGMKTLSEGSKVPPGALAAVASLDDAATACFDMSELIGHATLRFIDVEEQIIDAVVK